MAQNVLITGAGRSYALGYNMVLRYLEKGDREFVDRMRKWGRIPLDSDKSVKRKKCREMSSIEVLMAYMKMAEDYWKLRESQFNEMKMHCKIFSYKK